jgi:hypothetical protein
MITCSSKIKQCSLVAFLNGFIDDLSLFGLRLKGKYNSSYWSE